MDYIDGDDGCNLTGFASEFCGFLIIWFVFFYLESVFFGEGWGGRGRWVYCSFMACCSTHPYVIFFVPGFFLLPLFSFPVLGREGALWRNCCRKLSLLLLFLAVSKIVGLYLPAFFGSWCRGLVSDRIRWGEEEVDRGGVFFFDSSWRIGCDLNDRFAMIGCWPVSGPMLKPVMNIE